MRPFFTIGVTTYDRVEMLIETLHSILGQTFSDFEVIVSNDNPNRVLSDKCIGINDSRIRFLNNPENLGEFKNMNLLLNISRGRYFTWIADDDLYDPVFLQNVYLSLIKFNFPSCVFTSYKLVYGNTSTDIEKNLVTEGQLFEGHKFLNLYLNGRLKAIGVMGVFDTDYLKYLGGLEDVSDDGRGLYCEYMLIIKTGLLEKIVYIDAPLVFYRVHEGCWGCTNTNVEQYERAGENLTRKSIEIFRLPKFRSNLFQNFYSIQKLCMGNYINVLRRAGKLSLYQVLSYLFYAKKYPDTLRGSKLYWIAIGSLLKAEIRLIMSIVWHYLKAIVPDGLVIFVHRKFGKI